MANMNDCPEKQPLTEEYLEKMNACRKLFGSRSALHA